MLLEASVLVGKRYAPKKDEEEPGRTCRHCGAPLGPKDLFCDECGRATG